jgi:hypothetical protein
MPSEPDFMAGYARAIADIAQVAATVGRQAGEPAMEIAGQIVSVLAAHPERVELFRRDGSGLLIDGLLDVSSGCLTYRAMSGTTMTPAALRNSRGKHDH